MTSEGVLHIALHDGFQGETVELWVDGRRVYRSADVWTDPRIGLADTVDVSWDEAPAILDVAVLEAGVAGTSPLTPERRWVGVSIVKGRVAFRLSERPFGYA